MRVSSSRAAYDIQSLFFSSIEWWRRLAEMNRKANGQEGALSSVSVGPRNAYVEAAKRVTKATVTDPFLRNNQQLIKEATTAVKRAFRFLPPTKLVRRRWS